MIELKEWQYKLIQRLKEDNYKHYEIIEVKGNYYVSSNELLEILDDTENCREYAEEKLIMLSDEFNKYKEREQDNIPGLEKSLQREVNRLKDENDKLKEKNKRIRKYIRRDRVHIKRRWVR